MSSKFDCVVIGAGSGGVRAARMAAQKGAKVAVVESSAMGGTCVNLGCIPKKLYSYAAEYATYFEDSKGFGWQWHEGTAPVFSWETLKENRRKEIQRLNGIYTSLLTQSGVEIKQGYGVIVSPTQVKVIRGETQEVLETERILIATGGQPTVPEFEGSEWVITSNEVFDLPAFPQRLVIVGGGYIASEFASIFNGLGSQVTQLYRGEQILRGFDDDIRHFVANQMVLSGIDLRVQTDVQRIEKRADDLLVHLKDGSQIVCDQVLYATGRHPNIQGLGFEDLGGRLGSKGEILVDEYYRTSIEGIDALGDVTGRIQLTPVALAEAMVWVDNHFGAQQSLTLSYDNIATAVFTHPNIGTVGYTQEAAQKQFAIKVFRSEFRPLRHTISGSHERMMMKLIVDAQTDRVLGLHVAGAEAGEIVQGFAVAIKAGLRKSDFDATIGIHPTAAEELVTMRTPVFESSPQ